MATLYQFQPGQERLLHMMMLDFTVILIGYDLPRDEAREIATKAVDVAREHLAGNSKVLRKTRF